MACLIETPRLRLEPLGPAHISPAYAGWLNDPALMRFSQHGGRHHDPESCRAYARGFDHETRCLWAILERGSGAAHIGNINAYLTPAHGLGDVGLLIGTGAGKGYGREAWQGVIQALFAHYGLRKVTGGCLATHEAMRAIMVRTGMVPDGRRKSHYLQDGEPVDILHMAIFAKGFNMARDVTVRQCPPPVW